MLRKATALHAEIVKSSRKRQSLESRHCGLLLLGFRFRLRFWDGSSRITTVAFVWAGTGLFRRRSLSVIQRWWWWWWKTTALLHPVTNCSVSHALQQLGSCCWICSHIKTDFILRCKQGVAEIIKNHLKTKGSWGGATPCGHEFGKHMTTLLVFHHLCRKLWNQDSNEVAVQDLLSSSYNKNVSEPSFLSTLVPFNSRRRFCTMAAAFCEQPPKCATTLSHLTYLPGRWSINKTEKITQVLWNLVAFNLLG